MRGAWLALRAHRLVQFLVVCSVAGAAGAVLGRHLTPVPGQLFADVAGIPLVYLVPVVVSVSLAQWAPVGTWWIETGDGVALARAGMTVGILLATVPVLATTSLSDVALVAARNTALLVGLVLVLRRRASSAASSTAAVVPGFVVWTFGWDQSGHPLPWAILLAPAWSAPTLALTASLLVTGLTMLRSATSR